MGIELDWGGDKGQVFWGIFFGLPLGCVCGFLVIDKVFFGTAGWNVRGIVSAIVVGVLGDFLGIFLMDSLGGQVIFFLPVLIVLACECAYNLTRAS